MQTSVTIDSFPKEQPRTVTWVSLLLSRLCSSQRRSAEVTSRCFSLEYRGMQSPRFRQNNKQPCHVAVPMESNEEHDSWQHSKSFCPVRGARCVLGEKKEKQNNRVTFSSVRKKSNRKDTERHDDRTDALFLRNNSGTTLWEYNYLLKRLRDPCEDHYELRGLSESIFRVFSIQEVCRWTPRSDRRCSFYFCLRSRREKSSFDEFHSRELFRKRNPLSGRKNDFLYWKDFANCSIRFGIEEEKIIHDSFLRTRAARKADRVNRVDTGTVSCSY